MNDQFLGAQWILKSSDQQRKACAMFLEGKQSTESFNELAATLQNQTEDVITNAASEIAGSCI